MAQGPRHAPQPPQPQPPAPQAPQAPVGNPPPHNNTAAAPWYKSVKVWVITVLVIAAVVISVLGMIALVGGNTPNSANPGASAAKPPAPRICTRQQAARGECTRADTPVVPAPAAPVPTTSLREVPPVTAAPNEVRCDKVFRVVTGSSPIVGLSGCRLNFRLTQGCVNFVATSGGAKTTVCHNTNPDLPPVKEIEPINGPYVLYIIACPVGSTPAPDKFACT